MFDADHFEFNRNDFSIKKNLVEKSQSLKFESELKLVDNPPEMIESVSSDDQIKQVAQKAIELEEKLSAPQDIEWAFEKGEFYLLQTRPITNLPVDSFFDSRVGADPILDTLI